MTSEELKQLLGGSVRFQSATEKERWQATMREKGLDPNSYYQEIEMSAPYVNAHRDVAYTHEAMTLHSHAFYEILCCRSNCGAEYLVGPYRYSLQKGDIIMVRPGISHCAILPDPLVIPYERDILWINMDFVTIYRKLANIPQEDLSIDLPTYLFRTAGTPWESLCDLIHACVQEEANKPECWQANLLGLVMQFLSQLCRAYRSHTSVKAEKTDLLDHVIAYVDVHYADKIVMSDLGKKFFVSERTISTLFRQRLGVTFYQFLTQRRLIAAKTLILEGVSLESAASQTGFSDYSSFYRAFKQEFGIPPRQFKKGQCKPIDVDDLLQIGKRGLQ